MKGEQEEEQEEKQAEGDGDTQVMGEVGEYLLEQGSMPKEMCPEGASAMDEWQAVLEEKVKEVQGEFFDMEEMAEAPEEVKNSSLEMTLYRVARCMATSYSHHAPRISSRPCSDVSFGSRS